MARSGPDELRSGPDEVREGFEMGEVIPSWGRGVGQEASWWKWLLGQYLDTGSKAGKPGA